MSVTLRLSVASEATGLLSSSFLCQYCVNIVMKNMKIMLIEDDAACVMVFKYRFSKFQDRHPNLEIQSAPDLKEADEILKTFDAGLIVLDLTLKRTAPDKVISQIKRLCKKAPVLVMSGTVDKEMKNRVKEAGAVGFLSKLLLASDEIVGRVVQTYLLYNR